jgi:hypothetical protein
MKEEAKFIKDGLLTKLDVGDKWQLFSIEWFTAWKLYSNFDRDLNDEKLEV